MMHDQRHKWTKPRKLLIHCGTWNVNAKVPKQSIREFVFPQSLGQRSPDIYCIGIQEVVELNAMNIGMSDVNSAKQSSLWEDKFRREMEQSSVKYTKILGKHFVGLMMVVYAREDLCTSGAIRDCMSEKIGVGRMGLGNKGAICIRMQLWETSICFVNSHLTAGKSKVDNRNSDYETIMSKVAFRRKDSDEAKRIRDHDYCFWVGDLNYRLTSENLADVYKRIRAQPPDMIYLLNADQLIQERNAGRTFSEFNEPAISFLPTYKYIPGTARYDDREDGKRRMPAWCDRIQWYTDPHVTGIDVKTLSYDRVELHCSDHKPVVGLFEISAMVPPTREKKANIRQEIIRKLDEYENEHIPQVSLSKNTINLGKVRYDVRSSDSLVVTNTGKAMAEFHFVPMPGEDEAIKPWVDVSPTSCLLVPGKSTKLTVSVRITREWAQEFTGRESKIEHILILQLKESKVKRGNMQKSQFISIEGSYLPSCLGASLGYLVSCRVPLRAPDLRPVGPNESLSIPKEIWRLVDYLYRQGGLYENDLFVSEGDPKQVAAIIEALDTGVELPKSNLHSVAEALVRVLGALSEPVFPAAILEKFVQAWTENSVHLFCKRALTQLNPQQYKVFVYVVAFMRELLKHRQHNKLSSALLVPIFAKCLFDAEAPEYKFSHKVLTHFLETQVNLAD